jgi:hypothetical protein
VRTSYRMREENCVWFRGVWIKNDGTERLVLNVATYELSFLPWLQPGENETMKLPGHLFCSYQCHSCAAH